MMISTLVQILLMIVPTTVIYHHYIYKHASLSVIGIILLLFGISVFPISLLASNLFNKQWVAKVITSLLFYGVMDICSPFILQYNSDLPGKLIGSIIPQNALILSMEILSIAEQAGLSISLDSNMFSIKSYRYNVGHALMMMALSNILLLIISIYSNKKKLEYQEESKCMTNHSECLVKEEVLSQNLGFHIKGVTKKYLPLCVIIYRSSLIS